MFFGTVLGQFSQCKFSTLTSDIFTQPFSPALSPHHEKATYGPGKNSCFFQQRFHILLVYQVILSYKLGNYRKLGLRGRTKLQITGIYNPVNYYDGEFLQK